MPEEKPAKKTIILGMRGTGRTDNRAASADRKFAPSRRAAEVKITGIMGEEGMQTRSAYSRQTKDEHQQPEAQMAGLPHHSPRHQIQRSSGYSPAGKISPYDGGSSNAYDAFSARASFFPYQSFWFPLVFLQLLECVS